MNKNTQYGKFFTYRTQICTKLFSCASSSSWKQALPLIKKMCQKPKKWLLTHFLRVMTFPQTPHKQSKNHDFSQVNPIAPSLSNRWESNVSNKKNVEKKSVGIQTVISTKRVEETFQLLLSTCICLSSTLKKTFPPQKTLWQEKSCQPFVCHIKQQIPSVWIHISAKEALSQTLCQVYSLSWHISIYLIYCPNRRCKDNKKIYYWLNLATKSANRQKKEDIG